MKKFHQVFVRVGDRPNTVNIFFMPFSQGQISFSIKNSSHIGKKFFGKSWEFGKIINSFLLKAFSLSKPMALYRTVFTFLYSFTTITPFRNIKDLITNLADYSMRKGFSFLETFTFTIIAHKPITYHSYFAISDGWCQVKNVS